MNHLYVEVPAATLLFLVIDLYPVIKSLSALFSTLSFWILVAIFTVLNALSFVILTAATPSAVTSLHLSASAAEGILLFLSTIGSISIIQSFSLKIANFKPIDLDQFFQKTRAGVLTDAASGKAKQERKSSIRLASKLKGYYTANPTLIDADYTTLMAFGGRNPATIAAEIAAASGDPLGKIHPLVTKMVLTDVDSARGFLFLHRN